MWKRDFFNSNIGYDDNTNDHNGMRMGYKNEETGGTTAGDDLDLQCPYYLSRGINIL